MEITKERFQEVYNKHLPNEFIKFVFKYYSKDEEITSGIKVKTDRIAWFILLPLFLLGMLFTIIGLPKSYIGVVTYPYMGILSALVLVGFVGVQMNNFRIRRIAKELGISLSDYNDLVDSLF